MMTFEQAPEFAGPQSEGVLFGADYGQPGYPSIGQPPRIMSVEAMEKERDQAARAYEMRTRIEQAALQAGASALEASAAYDRLVREAAEIAAKAAPA